MEGKMIDYKTKMQNILRPVWIRLKKKVVFKLKIKNQIEMLLSKKKKKSSGDLFLIFDLF